MPKKHDPKKRRERKRGSHVSKKRKKRKRHRDDSREKSHYLKEQVISIHPSIHPLIHLHLLIEIA